MLKRAVLWSCPVCLGLASAAGAEIVIDHRPYNLGGPAADTSFIYYSGNELWEQVADDFLLTQSAIIRHVSWWGFYGDDFESPAEQPPATQTMRIRLYGARAQDGLPGAVLLEETVVDPSYAWHGRPLLICALPNEYKFDVDLTTPIHLTASTPYWLEIVQLGLPQSLYRWEFSRTGEINGFSYQNAIAGNWAYTQSITSDLAFQLSTIPEPQAAVLVGVVTLVLVRRRRGRLSPC